MSRGVNKVIIIGNVGQDPEVRFMPNGNPVCNLRLATTESWKDKQSGQRQEKTEWHSVVLFNKLAEIAQQYVKKGSRLYVEGRLQTRKWQAQDGSDRYSTEIIANDIQMLDSRPQSSEQQRNPPEPHYQRGGYGPGGIGDTGMRQQTPQQQSQQFQQPQNSGGWDDGDSEIHF